MEKNKVGRREAILMFGAAGAALTLGCGGDSPTSPTTTGGGTTTGGTGNAACAVTPSETAGPFPSLTDLIRSDIREGKSGTTLRLTIAVVNSSNNCSPVENVNVEIWQCDATGNYSQYGSQTGQTYLRGIQTTNSGGEVTFTTVYPGWYQGRATHIHAEVTRNGSVGQDDADRVSGVDECHGVRDRRVCLEGDEPDVQHARRYLCRQHRFGAGHRHRRPVERIHGHVPDCDLLGRGDVGFTGGQEVRRLILYKIKNS